MALKLTFYVGSQTFEAEGDFTFDAGLLEVVKAWTRALTPESDEEVQDLVNMLSTRVDQSNQALRDATDAAAGVLHPPQEE